MDFSSDIVAGVLIGLNWLTVADSGISESIAVQHEERVPAPVQGTRPGVETGDVTDLIIELALTSQRKSGDNTEAFPSPPPVAILQHPDPDRRAVRDPDNDIGK